MYSEIIVTTNKRSGVITLNRPERRNALNGILMRELIDGITALSKQDLVRTIVLTGAGEGFCAGMDIQYILESVSKAHEENVEEAKLLLKLLLTVQNSRKPVIAMVNGSAMGGGCGLAAACDFVFAGENKARFGVPEVRLGFVPAVILHFLIKRMGEGKAREFVLQGEIAAASKAKQYGLVTETIPDNALSDHVQEFAEKLAAATSPSSITFTKELFTRLDEMNHREGLDYASNLNAMVRKTDDFKKGLESFLKKENLQW